MWFEFMGLLDGDERFLEQYMDKFLMPEHGCNIMARVSIKVEISNSEEGKKTIPDNFQPDPPSDIFHETFR